MTKRLSQQDLGTANGAGIREAAFIGSSPEYTATFEVRDIAGVQVPEFSVPEPAKMSNGMSAKLQKCHNPLTGPGAASKFQTDSDISGNRNRGERMLQRWVPDESDNPGLSLEAGSVGNWDQFATNRHLTGMESTYDENIYTTAIDRSATSYRAREAYAEKVEREIEGSDSTNVHMREERGHAAEQDGDDEETKYSGVKRGDATHPLLPTGAQNKYTPPARRAPAGQAGISGVPVDPAIVSAQLAKPDKSVSKAQQVEKSSSPAKTSTESTSEASTKDVSHQAGQGDAEDPSSHKAAQDQTEGVATRVLEQFRQFADSEKQKLQEKKRAQASQDRAAKLNDLKRFSTTFKLKTPVPNDMVGILAKDPQKQEALIEKAKRGHEDSANAHDSSTSVEPAEKTTRRADLSQIPTIPDRQPYARGRGGYPQGLNRAQQQNLFAGRNAANPTRPTAGQDRKPSQLHQIPAPIPILDGRLPPTGPSADQAGLPSPQRSNIQTPTSTTSSSRFNMNVRASEFRPSVTAPAFNPTGASNTASSPSSTQRAASVSRAASPSAFFGSRKPKPTSERPSLSANFDSIKKLKNEVLQRLAGDKTSRAEGESGPPKDYAANGGIPNAFQTAPRWTVVHANENNTYETLFEKAAASTARLVPSRAGSSHQVPYQAPMGHVPNGPSNVPQISTPHHMQHGGPQQFGHQMDEGQRMQMGMGHTYSSPSIQSRQPSTFASPMANPAQLAYAQPPYFGGGNAQMTMPMRQYPGTPGLMHPQPGQMSAPIMVQQQSSGPYMQMPQQFNQQMPMYSPSPAHAYPQQNGYGSPSRAPMMVQQGSQQGHHHGQPMMYTMSSQGQMGYPQQTQMHMMRGGYGGHQYGSSPQQPYMQQRAMSNGYGQIPQKGMPHHMQHNQGPPMNAPQQPAAYAQSDQDEGK